MEEERSVFMSIDLTTNFCGIEFANPVIVPAGVHGRDGDTIKEVSGSGVAGICTKTIVSQPARDVLPCFSAVKAGMVNSVFGSDKTSEYWFSEGIKRGKEGNSKVIANLAGFTPEEAAGLAVKAEESGADMIMLPTHCPHMGEILMAMFEGLEFPEPKLTDVGPMRESVRLIKKEVAIPVVVKLSGTFSNIVKEWALGIKESGADGIACSDAVGPALSIDIRTGQPALGGPRGVGGLTGSAIMPITLRMVLEAVYYSGLPAVGVGGVTSAEDVIQYIMAGASLVGVCTAGHLRGLKAYTDIIEKTAVLTEELGYSSLEEIRGLTQKKIEERKENNTVAVTDPIVPKVLVDECTACKKCVPVCAYNAISVEGKNPAAVDSRRCIGCGLCVSVCPFGAFEQNYYEGV